METWTRQLKRSVPLTRHYAVAIVDAAGDTLERIEVSTLTYTALRRIAHDTPTQAALKHTPGVAYEDPGQVMSMKRRAHQVVAAATRFQDQLQAAIAIVHDVPGVLLSQADAYLREAEPALRSLAITQVLEGQIQRVGPPLFQLGVMEVLESLERAEAAVAEVTRFIAEVAAPKPAVTDIPVPISEPAKPKTWYAQALDAEEKLRVPAGLLYPVPILRKQQPALKPLNAAYLRLLEGFWELVTGSAWEKRIFHLFDETELEQMPDIARQYSRAEVAYLSYVCQHWTEPQSINDSYLEGVRHTLCVQWLKNELLRHLAEL
ncbi:hypothetical protein GCM10027422_17160 [Hymenobacter arcticus]